MLDRLKDEPLSQPFPKHVNIGACVCDMNAWVFGRGRDGEGSEDRLRTFGPEFFHASAAWRGPALRDDSCQQTAVAEPTPPHGRDEVLARNDCQGRESNQCVDKLVQACSDLPLRPVQAWSKPVPVGGHRPLPALLRRLLFSHYLPILSKSKVGRWPTFFRWFWKPSQPPERGPQSTV